jgi:hypothetical protein
LQNWGHRVVSGSGSCIRFRLVSKYKSYCRHSHVICIRVDATAEGAVYEVIARPQEQRGQVQQENCEHPAQGPAEPSVEQQPEGKPRCTSYYFKLWHLYMSLLRVH